MSLHHVSLGQMGNALMEVGSIVLLGDHQLDAEKVQLVREAFTKRVQAFGNEFVRPMHVRVFRRTAH